MNLHWIEAVTGLVVALAGGGIGTWAITAWRARSQTRIDENNANFKNKSKQNATTVGELHLIIDRLQEREQRVVRQMEIQQETISRQGSDHSRCREQVQELYGHVRLLWNIAQRQNRSIRDLNGVVEDVPPMPELKPYARSRESEEREVADTQTSTTLLSGDSQAPHARGTDHP